VRIDTFEGLRILVTGGTGSLGEALVRRLLSASEVYWTGRAAFPGPRHLPRSEGRRGGLAG